jgi:hypothetical protein
MEHKRRSSLGIFGWMKGKRSDSVSVPGVEKFIESERLPFIQPKMPSELRRLCSMPWDVEGRPETVL